MKPHPISYSGAILQIGCRKEEECVCFVESFALAELRTKRNRGVREMSCGYIAQCHSPHKVAAVLLTSYNMPSKAPSAFNASGVQPPRIDVANFDSNVHWVVFWEQFKLKLQSKASINFQTLIS